MMEITLRQTHSDDEPFIFQLFVSGRPDLAWVSGISEAMKNSLIHQQYQYEKEQMFVVYPEAHFCIVLFSGEPVGRLYIHRGTENFRVLAITLLPEFRGRGIGGKLLAGIQEEASVAGKRVRLQVAWYNYSARSLYEKLGFTVVQDAGVYCEMQWTPAFVGA
jgi:ribosomal protein S18 acetylase RimI-like enzyme